MTKTEHPDGAEWNPRYVWYAKAERNTTPEKALEIDKEEYPGGCMYPYIQWIQDNLKIMRERYPDECVGDRYVLGKEGQEKFNAHLMSLTETNND